MENTKITTKLSKINENSSILEKVVIQPFEIFIENEKKLYQLSKDNLIINHESTII